MHDLMALLPSVVWIGLSSPPLFRLLRRNGLHIGLLAINILPVLGSLILLWIIAYWPNRPAR